MENEEVIYCNLEGLLVLLCLKVARRLHTCKELRHHLNFVKHSLNTSNLTKHLQTRTDGHGTPNICVCLCLPENVCLFVSLTKETHQHGSSAKPLYFGVEWQALGNVFVSKKVVKLTMIQTSGSD